METRTHPFNIEKFEINPSNEFHILRHFSYIEGEYANSLVGKESRNFDYSIGKFAKNTITKDGIKHAVSTLGSKFIKNISGMENPKKLLEWLKEKIIETQSIEEVVRKKKYDGRMTTFSFYYPSEVGHEGVLVLDELTEEQKNKVVRVPRSTHPSEKDSIVNYLGSYKPTRTKHIMVEVHWKEYLPFYSITAYPSNPHRDSDGSTKDIGDYTLDELVFIG